MNVHNPKRRIVLMLLCTVQITILWGVAYFLTASKANGQQPTPLPTSALASKPTQAAALEYATFNLRNLAWSPNSRFLAIGGGDGVRIFDEQFQQMIHFPHQPYIRSLSWSPDGRYIAAVSWDETIWVWEVATQDIQYINSSFDCLPRQVAWSPDLEIIASANQCGEITLWNPLSGVVSQVIQHTDFSWSKNMAWHPSGAILFFAEANNTYQAWDIDTNQLIWREPEMEPTIPTLSLSPNGAVVSIGAIYVSLLDARTGKLIQTFEYATPGIRAIDWSPDGERLAVQNKGYTEFTYIYDVQTGEVLHEYPIGIRYRYNENVADILNMENTLDWSPDGTKLAAITDGTQVYVWDMASYDVVTIITIDAMDQ